MGVHFIIHVCICIIRWNGKGYYKVPYLQSSDTLGRTLLPVATSRHQVYQEDHQRQDQPHARYRRDYAQALKDKKTDMVRNIFVYEDLRQNLFHGNTKKKQKNIIYFSNFEQKAK